MVLVYDYVTKMSVVNPFLTATIPTLMHPTILTFGIVFNVVLNQWYAHGNILLVGIQIFTLVQAFFMFLLIWDVPFYLYTLRILRYIVLLVAIIFLFMYVVMILIDFDLLYLVNEWKSHQKLFNGVLATLLSYMAMNMFPTFCINF